MSYFRKGGAKGEGVPLVIAMPLFSKKNKKEERKKAQSGVRKGPSPELSQHYGRNGSISPKPSPNSSLQNLAYRSASSKERGYISSKDRIPANSVKDKVAQYEQKSSPDKKKASSASVTSLDSRERSVASPVPSATASQTGSYASLLKPEFPSQPGSSHSSVASPVPEQVPSTKSTPYSRPFAFGSPSPPPVANANGVGRSFEGYHLPLPPLQTAVVKHRKVTAEKNPTGGGFGFLLRHSYLPVPDDPGKTRSVHLVEPRPGYMGSLMTGDRIIEVNNMRVEDEPHDRVVELIKASGDCVELLVASIPELLELNARVFQGSDNPFSDRGNKLRKSNKMKPGQTGTLRKQAALAKKAFKVG